VKPTSFFDLLHRNHLPNIEIPIIQRDYAQGRDNEATVRIRNAFLDVLHRALVDDKPVHLDFVYGEVKDGALVPLDGQQRLTALFLLHWYLAARAGIDQDSTRRLPQLTYETRESSRTFCRTIVGQRPFPLDAEALSEWVRDQSWFVSAWRHDPTIDSMLVVLDALHQRFRESDCQLLWGRLVDSVRPAITFHFLPVADLGLTDELYIKMNSRGKPLTPFENFKAEFEELVRKASPSRYAQLCERIDNRWTDLFWKVRGDDNLIDDEFMKYFQYVTEMVGVAAGLSLNGDELNKATLVYGQGNTAHDSNLEFLFRALDDWHDRDVAQWFGDLFTRNEHAPGKVALFDDVDLFRTCCHSYGDSRNFPLWKALLLSAVLTHLRHSTAEFPQRLRTLRNLALNSPYEIRQDTLQSLLNVTSRFVRDGDLEQLAVFSGRQIAEEKKKADLLAVAPALTAVLQRLEDHPLLRGCLAAFELDSSTFERRATAFCEIFSLGEGLPVPNGSAALLASGHYAQRTRQGRFQFANSSVLVWRELLTNDVASDFKQRKYTVNKLLDEVAKRDGTLDERLSAVVSAYLVSREETRSFDWRYYMVKYPHMRAGASGLYASEGPEMGFGLCMLRKTQMNSYYRDGYFAAMCGLAGEAAETEANVDAWFTGYARDERWLNIRRSNVRVRCAKEGLRLKGPTDDSYRAAFEKVCSEHSLDSDGLLRIPQETRSSVLYDTKDRVELGAKLLLALIAMQPV
jgi:hypothetical protein